MKIKYKTRDNTDNQNMNMCSETNVWMTVDQPKISKRSLKACVPGCGGTWRVGSQGVADCGRAVAGAAKGVKSLPPNMLAPGVFERLFIDFLINSCVALKSAGWNGSDSSSFGAGPADTDVALMNGSSARTGPNGSLAPPNAFIVVALAGRPNGSGKLFVGDVTCDCCLGVVTLFVVPDEILLELSAS